MTARTLFGPLMIVLGIALMTYGLGGHFLFVIGFIAALAILISLVRRFPLFAWFLLGFVRGLVGPRGWYRR